MLAILLPLLSICQLTLSSCPVGAIQGNNPDDCYKFFSMPKNWVNAEEDCLGQNGHLASISNVFQNSFLQNQLQAIAYYSNSIWVGGNTITISGIWTWSDNSAFSFVNWAQGQPLGNQNLCTSFNSATGTWFSQGCTSMSLPYLCKVSSVSNPGCPTQVPSGSTSISPTRSSKNCRNGYTYFSGTQMCYKFYSSTNLNFNKAETMCQNDGANLASIHSPEENSYIANSTYMYLQQERNVWIGIYLDNSTLTWKWTDGSFVDYTNWGFERPFPGDGCGILVNSQWPNYCNTTNFCNWFGLWDTQSSYDCTLSNSKIVYAACKMSPN